METAHLALKNLKQSYGSTGFTLEVPFFEIETGQRLVVLGENGSGKSTLVRILGLLERPSFGEIYYRGKKVTSNKQVESIRAKIATLFQRPVILAGKVRKNLELISTLRKSDRSEVEKLVSLFELEDLLDRFDRELSLGQTRIVQLALTFLGNPEVIILDEPTSFLDEQRRKNLIELIMQAVKPSQTLIYVTHRLDEALRLGRKIAVLKNGKIAASGSPEVVFTSLKDELTNLYGEISVLKGKVVNVENGLVTVSVNGIQLQGLAEDRLNAGESAALLFRNDAVVLSLKKGGSSVRNTFEAVVEGSEPLVGAGGVYRVAFKQPFYFQALITRSSLEQLSIEPGKRVFASVKASSIRVYKSF